MKRRDFLASVAATACPLILDARSGLGVAPERDDARTFASPAEAAKSPPETLAYVVALYEGTGIRKPDYLATIDVDPKSKTYSQVVHRLRMPNVGDELHHFGWNACASCHGEQGSPVPDHPRLALRPDPHRRHRRPPPAEAAQGDRAG